MYIIARDSLGPLLNVSCTAISIYLLISLCVCLYIQPLTVVTPYTSYSLEITPPEFLLVFCLFSLSFCPFLAFPDSLLYIRFFPIEVSPDSLLYIHFFPIEVSSDSLLYTRFFPVEVSSDSL